MSKQDLDNKKRTPAFWFLIITSIFLTIMYLAGQTMAIINYDFAVSTGLQEPANEITDIGVAFNKGFGFGDTFVYIPLLVIGILGLIRKKEFGLYVMIGAMAITAYWPAVALSALYYAKGIPGWAFTDYNSYNILLTAIAFFGVWAIFYLFKNRKELSH